MIVDGPLLEPPGPCELKAHENLGKLLLTGPPRAKQKGLLGVLRLSFSLTFSNLLPLVVMAVPVGLVAVLALGASVLLLGEFGGWGTWAGGMLGGSVCTVLVAGYKYGVLLSAMRLRTKIWTPFTATVRGSTFLNVWLAALLAGLVPLLFAYALRLIGEPVISYAFPEGEWALRLWATVTSRAAVLLCLPLAFAPLDVLITKRNFLGSARHCLTLAHRSLRLFCGYALFYIVVGLAGGLVGSWGPFPTVGIPGLGALMAVAGLAAVVLLVIFLCVFHALFYRELLLREREVKEPLPLGGVPGSSGDTP